MLLLCAALLVFACLPSALKAQTLTVRVLDAKSGKPLAGENITVRWDNDSSISGVEFALDKDGKARIDVRSGAKTLSLRPGPKRGNEPYRIAYLECNDPRMTSIAVDEVLAHGLLPANDCGRQKTQVHAGEIVYWGLPRRWWQPDMQ